MGLTDHRIAATIGCAIIAVCREVIDVTKINLGQVMASAYGQRDPRGHVEGVGEIESIVAAAYPVSRSLGNVSGLEGGKGICCFVEATLLLCP